VKELWRDSKGRGLNSFVGSDIRHNAGESLFQKGWTAMAME